MARRRVSGFQAPVFRSSSVRPQAEQRVDPGRGPEEGREHVRTRGVGTRDDRGHPEGAHHAQQDSGKQGASLGEHADPGARHDEHDDHPDGQGQLVVSPERRDREVLQPRGCAVDERAGDGRNG